MASISTDANGNRRILFFNRENKRKTLHLGDMPMRNVEEVKRHVENIVAAQLSRGSLERKTAEWLGDVGIELHRKLVGKGLATPRAGEQAHGLQAFIDAYIAGRTDLKPGTCELLRYTGKDLVAFLGADKPIADVTPADADAFRLYLMTIVGENSTRRRCGRAKQFFRHAVRKRLIAESPFADMKGTSVLERRDREFFVTREMAAKVLEACPDAQWRLLFALSRFGGLRCPSEHLALRWGDIDWDRNRIRVPSPKTEHHDGKGSRWIPLFPELLPHLQEVFEQAEPGTEFVITRHRDARTNLRNHLERIIRKAGLEPWPKPWQNLRSTRETELAESYPIHVVCSWIGNSAAVARKHYLQVTDEHFEKAAQNTAQQVSETVGNGGQPKGQPIVIAAQFPLLPTSTHQLETLSGLT